MRGAIHIPSFDCEQDNALGTRLKAFIEKPIDKGGIIFDHTGSTPKLDPLTARRVEQKKKGAVVLGQVGKRNVLPVATVIGKADRSVIDDFNKAFWPTSVLQIGGATRCCRGQECGILFGDKFCELRRDPVGKSPARRRS